MIYEKEFHFLDETLNQKHARKQEKLEIKKLEEQIEEQPKITDQFIAPIQLNNQKDFSHDQIDRSLSKMRKPELAQSIFSEKFQITSENPKNEDQKPLNRFLPEEALVPRY